MMTNTLKNMSEADKRPHLSEQVRVSERHWAMCEDKAARFEEGRSIIMAEMKIKLVEEKLAKSMAAAEDMARASEQWKNYVRKMHDARREANEARADWRALDRSYWGHVSLEAGERAQMRMAR